MPGGGQIDHLCMTKLLRSLDKYVSKYFTFSEPTAICGTITYYLLICRCNDLWCFEAEQRGTKKGYGLWRLWRPAPALRPAGGGAHAMTHSPPKLNNVFMKN